MGNPAAKGAANVGCCGVGSRVGNAEAKVAANVGGCGFGVGNTAARDPVVNAEEEA